MNALEKSLSNCRALVRTANENALQLKASGSLSAGMVDSGGMASFSAWQNQARYRERYSLFRGVLYAAINAIAMAGAQQPVCVATKKDEGKKKGKEKPKEQKSFNKDLLPRWLKEVDELEVEKDHPLMETLEEPNPIQNRFQFVYSFIASLNLTGWAFIVGQQTEDEGFELYSVPTTWITPDHSDGPFSKFKMRNPNSPETEAVELTREQVAFAHLPNPADPMAALAPAASQMPAIRVDDHIWSSREKFFENGIFPGALVTVGQDPFSEGKVRPRLTGPQRRQVYAAIKKLMGGVANYGNPAIVDGMIEKVERLSMSSQEMGWDRSEKSTKTAILSAFCVHPYILGEAVSVGGYAQVANIEKRFFERVNAFLDMLGNLLSNFVNQLGGTEDVVVWWDRLVPVDPQMEWSNWKFGVQEGFISQSEFRTKLGLPPDEDGNQNFVGRQAAQVIQLLIGKADGKMTKEQAEAFLRGCGVPTPLAKDIAGPEVEPPQEAPQGPQEGGFGRDGQAPPDAQGNKPPKEGNKPGEGIEGKPPPKPTLEEAAKMLKMVPVDVSGRVAQLLVDRVAMK